MTTTLMIISIILTVLNIGLLVFVFRTLKAIEDRQRMQTKVFSDIWNKQRKHDETIVLLNAEYQRVADNMMQIWTSGKMTELTEQVKKLDDVMKMLGFMQDVYDDCYSKFIEDIKTIRQELDDLGSMTSDIWWGTNVPVTPNNEEITEEDLAFADEMLNILKGIDTGFDGIEEGLHRKYGDDLNTSYLMGPLHGCVDQIRRKIYAAKGEEYGYQEDAAEREEAPGVLEGAQEAGTGYEEDRPEPGDEHDEVQEASEDGEGDGEAGSGE